MSRYSFFDDNGDEIAYGFDHACGYFIQKIELDKDGNEIVSVDMDRFTSKRGEIIEKMMELNVPEEHFVKVALDLPF